MLLFIGLFLKTCIPLRWFGSMAIKQDVMTDEEEKNAVVSVLRKSYR
jgi:hypothetical protein